MDIPTKDMTRFRQKDFGKLEAAKAFVKKNPGIPLSAAMLAVSGTSLAVNLNNSRNTRKNEDKQLGAIKELTKTLKGVNKTLKSADEEKKKKKLFSIESGSYSGARFKAADPKRTAVIGAGIGAGVGGFKAIANNVKDPKVIGLTSALAAGIGGFSGWLIGLALKSNFNRAVGSDGNINSYELITMLEEWYAAKDEKPTETSETVATDRGTITKTYRPEIVKRNGSLYSVDEDPRKNIISVACQGSVMVMYIASPHKRELVSIDDALNTYCRGYKNADYIATKTGKDSYILEIEIVKRSEAAEIISDILDAGIKVNIMTGGRIGMKKL